MAFEIFGFPEDSEDESLRCSVALSTCTDSAGTSNSKCPFHENAQCPCTDNRARIKHPDSRESCVEIVVAAHFRSSKPTSRSQGTYLRNHVECCLRLAARRIPNRYLPLLRPQSPASRLAALTCGTITNARAEESKWSSQLRVYVYSRATTRRTSWKSRA